MTDKIEAQPEALPDLDIDTAGHSGIRIRGYSVERVKSLHAEIQQLKAQLSARQAAPDGWRLVPVEPTIEMAKAGGDVEVEGDFGGVQVLFGSEVKQIYAAMLSAAPPPPEREPLTDDLIWAMEQLMNWQVKNVQKWHNHAYDNAQHVLEKFKAAHGIGATNDNP